MFTRIVLLLILTQLLSACATSPLGRKQLLLFDEGKMSQMGIQAYQQIKQKEKVSTNRRTNAYVSCIAQHIIAELDPNQRSQWEVNVFNNKSANAFALPGRKIGVNTGMLTTAKSQSQLAAVMGHEVGHVLARHGGERMSIRAATQTGAQLAQIFIGGSAGERQATMALLGLGAQFGISLPFSRQHESEADIIGLNLMAKAGFDPRGSVQLWQNMAKGGRSRPEFMSTHPANQTRIRHLNANMQNAMVLYERARRSGKNPQCQTKLRR